MDTLALVIALTLAHDTDRAPAMQGQTFHATTWAAVERTANVSKPSEVAAISTRPTVKVETPAEVRTFTYRY